MMEHHPYAKLFPILEDQELQALADDIRDHGLRHAIVIDAHERIIDGRNRSTACLMAGVEPTYEVFPGNDREALAFVVSANLKRRHLTDSQRAVIAGKLPNMDVGRPEGTEKINRPDGPIKCEPPKSETETPKVSNAEAAGMLNVSERQVKRARRIEREGSPDLKTAVAENKISLKRAEEILQLPEEEQVKAIENPPKRNPPKRDTADASTSDNGKPGVGVIRANEAINCLIRIPKNDPLRKRGFQIVTDWIKANK